MIRKLKPDPVRHGKHFCIAKIEGGMCTEIEGRYTKGEYTVSLLHQPGYAKTYTEYGLPATSAEWKNAVALLYGQVTQLVTTSGQINRIDERTWEERISSVSEPTDYDFNNNPFYQ